MSIYCSYWDIDHEHEDGCKRLRKISKGNFMQDDSKPCTCGSCPIEYRGSHILPTVNDRRDGYFGFAVIPDHITDKELDFQPWKPFLRLHMNNETVVITKEQAKKFHEALTEWIANSAEK